MNVGVLWSGGKDSSLAALLLSPFATVELVSVSFGVLSNDAPARAHMLGYPHQPIVLDDTYAMRAITMMVDDGYPNNGINFIHTAAIERVAPLYETIADGTRREDRAPRLTIAEAQSVEDRLEVNYVRPLLGYGRRMVDALVAAHFDVIYGERVSFDYEVELRHMMTITYGPDVVSDIFPAEHVQSKVTARKA